MYYEQCENREVFLNKGTNSRLGLTKHSDLYEMIIVHPILDLFSLCVLSGAEFRKSLQDLQFSL